jgi:CheY-like chemotaxis protein
MGNDASQTGPPHRIVIVDDDEGTQLMLADVLHPAGYTTMSWTRGAGAYEHIRRLQPDLVILDLWLEHPQAGSMVLGLLMTDPATQHIPVIICSAYRQFLGYQEAQLQAQGYVLLDKPYRVDTLLTAIQRLLGEDQARAVGGL